MIQHQFTSKTKVEEITKGKAQKSETTHRIRFESHYKVVSGPDSLRGNTEPSFCQTYKYSFSLSHTDTDTVILAQWQKLVDRESRHSAPSEQCAIVGLSEVRSRRGRGGGGGRGLSTTLEGERDRSRGMKRKREGRAEIGKGGRKRGKKQRKQWNSQWEERIYRWRDGWMEKASMVVGGDSIDEQRISISKWLKATWTKSVLFKRAYFPSGMMFKGFTYTAGWGHSPLWSSLRNWWGRDRWPRWALLSTSRGRSCPKRWWADLWRSSSRPRWRLCSRRWRSPDRLRERRGPAWKWESSLALRGSTPPISTWLAWKCTFVTWWGCRCRLATAGSQYFDVRGGEPALLTLLATGLESERIITKHNHGTHSSIAVQGLPSLGDQES